MAIDISTARQEVTKIYIAAFNRTPDKGGLDFWVNAYLNGTSIAIIADGFVASAEYANNYPSYLTNSEYVSRIYQNVFARDVDLSGKTFWVGALNSGAVTKAGLLNELVKAAMANGSSDGLRLTNQADFGIYCATNDIPYTNVSSLLSSITYETSSLDAAKAAAITTGNTLTLTASDTTLTSSASINVSPSGSHLTNNGDTILASSRLNGSYIEDSKTTDTDTLTATITGGAIVTTIKNIETINLTTNQTASTSLLGVSGAKAINISGSSAMFDGAQSQALYLSSGYASTMTANVTTASSHGIGVTLNGTTTGAGVVTNSTMTSSSTPAILLSVAASSTLSTLDAGSSSAMINISGAGSLTITDSTPTGTFNASSLVGTLTFSDVASAIIEGTAQSDSFTQASNASVSINGNGGDDSFIFTSVGTLTSLDTINGGSGTDTLTTSGYAAATDLNNVTNIEFLTLTGASVSYNYTTPDSLVSASASMTVNASQTSGTSVLTLNGAAETNGTFSVTGTANADNITGGSLSDTINGGLGADTIKGGSGNDAITLTESSDSADKIIFDGAFSSGSLSADTITGFNFGSSGDVYDFEVALSNGTTTSTTNLSAIAPTVVADNGNAGANGVICVFTGINDKLASATTITNAVTNALTALTSGNDFANAHMDTGDSLLLLMTDGTNSFLFHYVADASNTLTTAGDLELVGIFNGNVTGTIITGDII